MLVNPKNSNIMTIALKLGILQNSDGSPVSPLTSTKTVRYKNKILDDVIVKIESDLSRIIGDGATTIPELKNLLDQLNKQKVSKTGDTMTGNLSVPELSATQIKEGNVTLSDKYAAKSHNHNTSYYTKTEMNNKFNNYYTKTDISNFFGTAIKTGSSTFAGSSRARTIAHGLGKVPSFACAFPSVNASGNLGEVWITSDSTNIYVYNSGSATSSFKWIAT